MTEWKQHTPGPCPIHEAHFVEVRMEDGSQLIPLRAWDIDWDHPGDDVLWYWDHESILPVSTEDFAPDFEEWMAEQNKTVQPTRVNLSALME